jgi:hypothetical protein
VDVGQHVAQGPGLSFLQASENIASECSQPPPNPVSHLPGAVTLSETNVPLALVVHRDNSRTTADIIPADRSGFEVIGC